MVNVPCVYAGDDFGAIRVRNFAGVLVEEGLR